jgi:hypothetical protein
MQDIPSLLAWSTLTGLIGACATSPTTMPVSIPAASTQAPTSGSIVEAHRASPELPMGSPTINSVLSISVTAPERTLAPGSVPVTLTVTNISKTDVLIANRFGVMPRAGDLEFNIFYDQKKLPFRLRVRLPPMKRENFVVLKSKESIEHKVILDKEYDFSKPGSYQMQVVYRIAEVPEEFKSAMPPLAKTETVSPMLNFTIEGATTTTDSDAAVR